MPQNPVDTLTVNNLVVTDGTNLVRFTKQINFTSGAAVTNAGSGEANVAVSGGAGGLQFQPFFGDTSKLWQRPSLSGLTWLNQGSATGSDPTGGSPTPNSSIGPLSISVSGPSTTLTGLMESVPAAPYTVTALIALPSLGASLTPSALSSNIQLFLYNNGNDHATAVGWYVAAINGTTLQSELQTNHYTATVGGPPSSSPQGFNPFGPVMQYILWMRLQNDGINLNYSFSYENINYIRFYTETLASLNFGTFTRAGFAIDTSVVASGISEAILWNFTVTTP